MAPRREPRGREQGRGGEKAPEKKKSKREKEDMPTYCERVRSIALHGRFDDAGDDKGGSSSSPPPSTAAAAVAAVVHVCSLVWLGELLLSPLLALLPDAHSATPAQRWTSVALLLGSATGFVYLAELAAASASASATTTEAATATLHLAAGGGVFSLASGGGLLRDSEELLQHVKKHHLLRVMCRITVKISLKCICVGLMLLLAQLWSTAEAPASSSSVECGGGGEATDEAVAVAVAAAEWEYRLTVVGTMLAVGAAHVALPALHCVFGTPDRVQGTLLVVSWVAVVLFVAREQLSAQLLSLFSAATAIALVWMLSVLSVSSRLVSHACTFLLCLVAPAVLSHFTNY